MKIILANGTELNPILVMGAPRIAQGATRDTLSFVFPADMGMDALDAAFTAEACESINIIGDDESEAIHKAYTVRAELKKEAVVVAPATDSTEAVFEDRITVSMAQRTYSETKMLEMEEALNLILSGETGV